MKPVATQPRKGNNRTTPRNRWSFLTLIQGHATSKLRRPQGAGLARGEPSRRRSGGSWRLAVGAKGSAPERESRWTTLRQVAGASSSEPGADATCRSRRQPRFREILPAGRESNQLFEFSRSHLVRLRAEAGGNWPQRPARWPEPSAANFLHRPVAERGGNPLFASASRRSVRLQTFRAGKLPELPAASFSHWQLADAPGRQLFAPVRSRALQLLECRQRPLFPLQATCPFENEARKRVGFLDFGLGRERRLPAARFWERPLRH
jgi:hypothetical protein